MPSEQDHTGGVNPLCPDTSHWKARDMQSAEDEVNEFISSLIRLVKPKFVVETGCYLGETSLAIAKALRSNGFGQLMTCDIETDRVKMVQDKFVAAGLSEIATSTYMAGIDLIKRCGNMIDFAFIDSSPYAKEREAEIKELLNYLKPYNYFLLHDTAPQHKGIALIPAKFKVKQVYLNCPRGLVLFQV
jgi:hypothetical protein